MEVMWKLEAKNKSLGRKSQAYFSTSSDNFSNEWEMKKCLLNTGSSFSRQSVPSGLRGKRIYGPYFKMYGP